MLSFCSVSLSILNLSLLIDLSVLCLIIRILLVYLYVLIFCIDMYSVICMCLIWILGAHPKGTHFVFYTAYALSMRLIFISEGLLSYNLLQSPLCMVDWDLDDIRHL